MLEAIVRELTSPGIERVLPGDGALYLLAALAAPGGSRPTPKARLKAATKTALSALPSDLVYRLLPPWKGPDSLSPAKLAFRALLANRTIALLEEDANVWSSFANASSPIATPVVAPGTSTLTKEA
jgi:hypothetical protein